jgi:hypothetical protein
LLKVLSSHHRNWAALMPRTVSTVVADLSSPWERLSLGAQKRGAFVNVVGQEIHNPDMKANVLREFAEEGKIAFLNAITAKVGSAASTLVNMLGPEPHPDGAGPHPSPPGHRAWRDVRSTSHSRTGIVLSCRESGGNRNDRYGVEGGKRQGSSEGAGS